MALRVLVAEDDPDHRFFISRALSSVDDVEVDLNVVEDGEEALDYLFGRGAFADADVPDLVILDLKMPRRNGLEVLAEVRSDPRLRAIPISMLSSSDRPEDIDETYSRGGNAYLRKRGFTQLRSDLHDATRFWAKTVELPRRPAAPTAS